MFTCQPSLFSTHVHTQQSDQPVSVLWVALVAYYLLIGHVESAAVAGATGLAGQVSGAIKPPPTQTKAAPETS